MPQNAFSRKYANFYSELNMRFTDELISTKQDCIGLENLSDVYEIESKENQVVFSRNSNVAVGAIKEVEKHAKLLGKNMILCLYSNSM